MKTLTEYARKWDRNEDNNFAVACYDQNTIEELSEPHQPENSDPHDCEAWGISPDEWADAIEAAFNQKIFDLDDI